VGREARIAMYENAAIDKALCEPPSSIRESVQQRIDIAVQDLLEFMLILKHFGNRTSL
jgi:hypothetical protein